MYEYMYEGKQRRKKKRITKEGEKGDELARHTQQQEKKK